MSLNSRARARVNAPARSTIRMRRLHVLALVASVVALGTATAPSAASAPPTSSTSTTVWLCRPGLSHNPCESKLDATVVPAIGPTKVLHTTPAANPPIDCFYVYPTVSTQNAVNANLRIEPEEIAIAELQAARFSSVCRVYAPMYHQLTLTAVNDPLGGVGRQTAETAFGGVVAAWRDYLAHDNHGRGVVFLGHSQGAVMIKELLRSEIDPNPALRRQMVSALILGGNVLVPADNTVGGDFQHLPACRAQTQTGCIVAYSTFAHPPPDNTFFGTPPQGISLLGAGPTDLTNLQVLCVNPAALPGGRAPIDSYFRTIPFPEPSGSVYRPVPSAPTPWVRYPGLYAASCQHANGATYLQVDDVGGAPDRRIRVTQTIGPESGLHIWDINLAYGNLLDLVRHQSAAYHR